MVKLLFDWLDSHPSSYWLIVSGPTLLLLFWTVQAVYAGSLPRPTRPESRLWGALVLLAFLLAWRWPWLLYAYQYSPDESQHVAGILTLADDPVFFRSVDGSTAGPLNFYLPLPLVLALGKIDFFTVRLAGLLLVWGALCLCYRAMVGRVGVPLARLGLLPGALFFATTTDWEFLHYSTEHAPVFLLCLCLWSLVNARASHASTGWLITAGLAAGLSPWAKLQIGPMSAVLILGGLGQIASSGDPGRSRLRQGLILILATLVPNVLAIGLLAPFGLIETAFQRYVIQGLIYADEGTHTFGSVLELGRLAWASHWIPAFAAGPMLLVPGAGLLALFRRERVSREYVACAVLTATAIFCVVLPGRAFQHYLMLLIIPVLLWGTAAAHDIWRATPETGIRPKLALGLFVLGFAPLALLRLSQPVPSVFGLFAEHLVQPRSATNELIHRLAEPGDKLALWGYAPEVYAATGLPQGTRDSYSYWSLSPGRWRDTYRTVYLEDIQRNQPAFFVDSVGPGSVYYQDREQQGYEVFPALAAYVATHYRPVVDRQNFRIFMRHDLYARRERTSPRFQATLQRIQADPLKDISPEPLTTVSGRRETLRGTPIIILQPPASLSCELTGTERALQLDYGFHPRAIAARASDGSSLIIEIISPDHPGCPVFRHFIDPGVPPGTRLRYAITVPLPPFPPGSRLVLSTDPGPADRRAWDWIYVARLKLQRSPNFQSSQFPGFNRLPESTSASTAYHLNETGTPLLMQHAPAQNTFRLKGTERTLSFSFGFQAGAYSGKTGATDGAIFRVELRRGQNEPVVLFERRLDPVANPADRGRQHERLALPDVAADDRLLVVIDPAGNASWDWTYLTDLTIE